MSERSKVTRPGLEYRTADITDMTECFEDRSYDVILDKGTLDTMLCYEKPTVIGAKVLKEVDRVLKPGGTYISISFASPDTRLETLQ
jgi:EEF1A lysine methyltransferase 4